MKSFAANEMLE